MRLISRREVYPEQNIIQSPHDNDALAHVWGQKLMAGRHGLNPFGMTDADPLIVQAEIKLQFQNMSLCPTR